MIEEREREREREAMRMKNRNGKREGEERKLIERTRKRERERNRERERRVRKKNIVTSFMVYDFFLSSSSSCRHVLSKMYSELFDNNHLQLSNFVSTSDQMSDFNGMSTHLGVFYA